MMSLSQELASGRSLASALSALTAGTLCEANSGYLVAASFRLSVGSCKSTTTGEQACTPSVSSLTFACYFVFPGAVLGNPQRIPVVCVLGIDPAGGFGLAQGGLILLGLGIRSAHDPPASLVERFRVFRLVFGQGHGLLAHGIAELSIRSDFLQHLGTEQSFSKKAIHEGPRPGSRKKRF
jgi:hypothetical protein